MSELRPVLFITVQSSTKHIASGGDGASIQILMTFRKCHGTRNGMVLSAKTSTHIIG